MKILRLILSMEAGSAPYNQFTIPVLDRHDITLLTFFPGKHAPDPRLDYDPGNGRIGSCLSRLWRRLRSEQYDVVHIHSPHLGVMFLLVALLVRPGLIRRAVLHLHSSYHVYRPRNRWMLLPGFLFLARIVCCSHASRDSFPAWWKHLAGRRLRTIRNAVDLRRVDLARGRVAARAAERPLRLVCVGRLLPLKNQITILRALALARAAHVHLKLVGQGPNQESLAGEASRLGLGGRVSFTGELSRDQVFEQLWDADGFVSMSTGEGLPVAVLEAMSCECPVLLSDILPHRELAAEDARPWPLLDAHDVRGLADQIERWAALAPEQRRAWGVACRGCIERSFTVDRLHEECEQLFAELAPRRPALAVDVA